jgi:lipopolysaccharide/colanic/teichoic acid biosynthesis glycosyltransferase
MEHMSEIIEDRSEQTKKICQTQSVWQKTVFPTKRSITKQLRVGLILKRSIDLAGSLFGLLILTPLMIGIALAIRNDSEGPVLYRQKRIGKNGKPFDIYKFRSMVNNHDDRHYLNYLEKCIESERKSNGYGLPYRKIESDSRITRVGKILRRYHLDELPQLWNVLRGEMSLVGPRPHIQFEVDHYTKEQRRRLDVPPGMTGLWQVVGREDCTFSELLALDLEYIDHWSIGLDFQILFLTFVIIFGGT